jgi:hypothetical protein
MGKSKLKNSRFNIFNKNLILTLFAPDRLTHTRIHTYKNNKIHRRMPSYRFWLFYYFTHSAFSELVSIEKWSEQVVRKENLKRKIKIKEIYYLKDQVRINLKNNHSHNNFEKCLVKSPKPQIKKCDRQKNLQTQLNLRLCGC